MCGRFVATRPITDIAAAFDVRDVAVPADLMVPRWNVAPTDGVTAVTAWVPADEPAPERRLTDYRWGLVPPWAKDPSIAIRAFNARAETLSERPSFRAALKARRCLIPADAFYEWQKVTGAGGKVVRRQPWCFRAADGDLLALAGLWEAWTPAAGATHEGARAGAGWHDDWLLSCTVITTDANELVSPVHDRMPVILQRADWASWLSQEPLDPLELDTLLKPAPADFLQSYPVSSAVNSGRADGPELMAPLGASS